MIDTCTVIDIAGDYAIIKYDSTGAEGQVALALLPETAFSTALPATVSVILS